METAAAQSSAGAASACSSAAMSLASLGASAVKIWLAPGRERRGDRGRKADMRHRLEALGDLRPLGERHGERGRAARIVQRRRAAHDASASLALQASRASA